MNYHLVEILEPLYETDKEYCVGVWDKHISDSIQDNEVLVVRTCGEEKSFDPKWVRDNCEMFEKVFKRPNEPMKLFKIFIPKRTKEEKEINEYETYLI